MDIKFNCNLSNEISSSAHCLYEGNVKNFLNDMDDESIQLLITSPPYNIGKEYETRIDFESYLDNQIEIIDQLINKISKRGSICWQVGNYVHPKNGEIIPLDIPFYNIFSKKGLKLRNRIVWHYGHGLHANKRLSGRYETILWFTKSDNYVFNLDDIRVPQKYPGKRYPKGHKKEGKVSGNPLGKNPGDIWDIPNVKANHIEKTDHPAQFPTALVRRLIRGLSDKGDFIFDPYLGSGTTLVAAAIEERIGIGAEIKKEYYQIIKKRLDDLSEGKNSFRDDIATVIPDLNTKVAQVPEEFK
jgi:adenine-specific DNA-methyltransferase